MEKQFLNENKYQKVRKGLIAAAITVIVITLTVSGVFFLAPGFSKFNVSDQDKQANRVKEVDLTLQQSKVFREDGFSREYYTLQDQLSEVEKTSPIRLQSEGGGYIAIGFFIIFFGVIMVGGGLLYLAFGRNIFAFGAQTAVPVAKEVIEDVAPIIGKAYGEAAKAAAHGLSAASKDMGPAFGTIAKEVSKGIKEGFKEDKPKTKE